MNIDIKSRKVGAEYIIKVTESEISAIAPYFVCLLCSSDVKEPESECSTHLKSLSHQLKFIVSLLISSM